MGIIKKSFILALLAVAIAPTTAFAYSFTECKMGEDVWYKSSSVFMDESRESMRQAMAAWNLYIPEGRRACFDWSVHTKTSFPSYDGENLIYKTYDSDPVNLATNYYWWNSAGLLLESDININSAQPWANGAVAGAYDVRSVMQHEIGHTIGLGHSDASLAIMYPTLSSNTVKTAFTNDDLLGLAARYA